jgi:hypothetical protein
LTRRLLLPLVLLFLGAFVISNTTYLARKQQRAILEDRLKEYNAALVEPLVDMGVELVVVTADPNGDELLEGKPKLRVLRCHRFGGMLDTRATPPDIVSKSLRPQRWFCSEDQEQVILHGDEPNGQLVYGSEGSGKTTVTALWHYVRWTEAIGQGREGGQTAPTKKRLKMVRDELFRLFPPTWYQYLKSENLIVFCDGTRLQLMHTRARSEAEGSPIQGFNWSWCAREEGQDQVERHDDIESRGRAAKNGKYKQLITATAKDSPRWREFRDMLVSSGQWVRRTLLGRRSPFVPPDFWDAKKLTMSPREYRRRVLAEDVELELAVYYGWERGRNLIKLPDLYQDLTAAILTDYGSYTRPGSRFTLLACHDPGNIFNTTEVLRLVLFGKTPVWFVVGELQTRQTTQREHALALRKYLADEFGTDIIDPRFGPEAGTCDKCAVFADPHGRGEGATDYQTVYMAMQQAKLDVFSPAPMTKRIKRTARVEMVNRLLSDAAGSTRLYVAADELGKPRAPALVDAFETLEKRAGDDDPEGYRRKDEDDKTHAPAALAYGLWPFEQEAITLETQLRARTAAGRRS